MLRGKARNSHDTIQYAISGWATHSLHDFNLNAAVNIYKECKIKIFDIFSELFAGSIKKSKIKELRVRTIDCLIEHAAIFPQSECAYTLHEMQHIIDQIEYLGPPRYSTLYMYERVNLLLKRMIKNKNHQIASMLKSYASEEFVTQSIGFNFKKMRSIINMFSWVPTDVNIIKKVLSSFSNLYIDRESQIYSLPNIKIHELRGQSTATCISMIDGDLLTKAMASYARTNSVLGKTNFIYYNLPTFYHFYHCLLMFTNYLLNFTIYLLLFTNHLSNNSTLL